MFCYQMMGSDASRSSKNSWIWNLCLVCGRAVSRSAMHSSPTNRRPKDPSLLQLMKPVLLSKYASNSISLLPVTLKSHGCLVRHVLILWIALNINLIR